MCSRYFEDVKSYESTKIYDFLFEGFGWPKESVGGGDFFPRDMNS